MTKFCIEIVHSKKKKEETVCITTWFWLSKNEENQNFVRCNIIIINNIVIVTLEKHIYDMSLFLLHNVNDVYFVHMSLLLFLYMLNNNNNTICLQFSTAHRKYSCSRFLFEKSSLNFSSYFFFSYSSVQWFSNDTFMNK